MLKVDYTLFIQIANFLILLLVLNVVLYRPIRRVLKERSEEVEGLERMIEAFEGNSSRCAAELQENRAGARKDGFREKEDLKGQGLDEEKSLLQTAVSAASEKVNKAKKDIEQGMMEARKSLEDETAAFSKELAEKILGRGI